jgi:predicted transcriptional regulator
MPRLRRELSAYLERIGSNPNSYAKQMGVSQSTVQRFLTGRTKNITGAMRPLLTYAGIRLSSRMAESQSASASPGSERIKQALAKVWDGSEASATALAQVIEAIGPFLSSGRGRASKA